jgi:hypothetical protein
VARRRPGIVAGAAHFRLASALGRGCPGRLYVAEFAVQQALRLYGEDVIGQVSRFPLSSRH